MNPVRARIRAQVRPRPPRHQATQRSRRRGRTREGDGFRHRALRVEPDDRGRFDHRHRAVPLARAGAWRARRSALGHLLGRVLLYELLTGSVPFTGDTPVEIAMKHLSAIPEPPSKMRPDVPRSLDLAVVRALAKDPAERYPSAEEMDAELARIEQGFQVSDETAEAATAVLAGARDRQHRRPGKRPSSPPARTVLRRGCMPPVRRRRRWPWVAAIAALIAAGVGIWFGVTALQDELSKNTLVTVPFVEGQVEALAKKSITEAGLTSNVRREPSSNVPEGKVIEQSPGSGKKIARGNKVTIFVSQGAPQVSVPNVVGMSQAQAEALLESRNLQADPHTVPNDEPENRRRPEPERGRARERGCGRPYQRRDGAAAGRRSERDRQVVQRRSRRAPEPRLRGAAQDVESNEPAETVVNQSPAPNSARRRDRP